jgi:hypothetical protein
MYRPIPISRQVRTLIAVAIITALPPAAAEANCADPGCKGIHFTAAYTGDFARNTTGGIQTGNSYIDDIDLQLAADRGSIFGIPGLSAFIYALHNNSADFSEKYVGDAQVVSNIDGGPDAWRSTKPGSTGHRAGAPPADGALRPEHGIRHHRDRWPVSERRTRHGTTGQTGENGHPFPVTCWHAARAE